jgi:hypothetical protein
MELLKNSIRAVLDRFGVLNVWRAPPIDILVAADHNQLVVRVSDQGTELPQFSTVFLRCFVLSAQVEPVLISHGLNSHEILSQTNGVHSPPLAGGGILTRHHHRERGDYFSSTAPLEAMNYTYSRQFGAPVRV